MRLSDTEWKVMTVLWDRKTASAREVLEDLPADTSWAYTTVKTILNRLQQKGIVSARMRANTSLYCPQITRAEARNSALGWLLDKAFDGTFGSLVHFLVEKEKLNETDRERLEQLLQITDRSSDDS